MTTLGQTLANRENAQKSTGPATVAGRMRSSMNGVTHGLCATRVVLQKEDAHEFAALKEYLLAALNPMNGEQVELAERIVALVWKRRRADRVETALWESGGGTDADMVVMLSTHGQELDRIVRYTRQIARELAACRQEYRKLQAEYARPVAVRFNDSGRMVDTRATMVADLAKQSAQRTLAQTGETAAEQEEAADAANAVWYGTYSRVLRKANVEFDLDQRWWFQPGWELETNKFQAEEGAGEGQGKEQEQG